MKELIKELKDFLEKEGFIWDYQDCINNILYGDNDKLIYVEDILDKLQELEKKYLTKNQ